MTNACPACLGADIRRAFRSGTNTFQRCRACGTVFEARRPTEAEVRRLYEGRDYFVKEAGDADDLWGYPADYLADRTFIEAKFDQVLRHLERYARPGRLLDVGAGPGFLVSAASARGWDAVGLDLNEWAAEYARTELGVDVRHGSLGDGTFAGERFDVVTMMDVIEHVPNPDELLGHARELVRPGGALVVLTPDAGAPLSRVLGRRWPEVQRPGEHVVLFSRRGLVAALSRHGFVSSGWHTTGKVATIATLLDDVGTVAPSMVAALRRRLDGRSAGHRVVELDPHTKFVLYARRGHDGEGGAISASHRPARAPKAPERVADVDAAILTELEHLASAHRYCDWLFECFAQHVPGARVLEVGAGIGTFTARMLDAGAAHVHLIEPETSCAAALEERFAGDPRVEVSRDELPDAPGLEGAMGSFDLVVCQNVLEHIGNDTGAVRTMAASLRPGGRLALVVPAGPALFGALDDAYGHWRRYDESMVRTVIGAASLEVEELRHLNVLGIPGWWAKNRRPGARVGAGSLRAYEALVALWRPIEERWRPGFGLTIACIARKEPSPVGATDGPEYAAAR